VGAFQRKFNGGGTDGFVAKISTTFNDTIGVYQPANNLFLLRNSNTTGPAEKTIAFGLAGDLPVTGDWDGNGSILFRSPSTRAVVGAVEHARRTIRIIGQEHVREM